TDFAQERKWKKAAAKKCARMVLKYHQERDLKAERAEKEELQKLRRIAGQVAKEIKLFWANIEKLVEFKQQTRLEEKRKKALDLHLNFIMDQTEKYSSWLREGMADRLALTSALCSQVDDSRGEEDEEFLVGEEEGGDDEATMEEQEEQEQSVDHTAELKELAEEGGWGPLASGEMSLEALYEKYRAAYSSDFEVPNSIAGSDEDEDVEVADNEQGKLVSCLQEYCCSTKFRMCHEVGCKFGGPRFAGGSTSGTEGNVSTVLGPSGVPVGHTAHELRCVLRARRNLSDWTSRLTGHLAADSEDSSEEEEEDEDEEEEEEEDMDTSSEGEVQDIGMEYLINPMSDEVDAEAKASAMRKSRRGDSCKGPTKEITDIAATAQSFQPKGNTLSTTQVATKVPWLLKHTLREYQHIGLDWLVTMHDKKLNGILADEMGLGKTIQTISLLAHMACDKGVWGPHLIVVPTSVMLNWEMEFKKWCPAFKILTYYGVPKERKQKRQGWTKPNAFHVCITSYKLVVQDHQAFRRKKWKYFILDEAQNIKNFKSQRWQMLLNFQSSRRLLLTGTPLQNSLMELWSLMHFLMPNVFQSHREFREWFANPVTGMIEGNSDYNESLIRRLHKVLRPFLLRRLKCEVEKQLPKKYEHVVFCQLTKRQRYLYDDFMAQTKTKETLATGNFMSVINVLMQLRKVCNHPNMFEPRPIVSPYRMEGLVYYTASCVYDICKYNPFKHVSFSALNLLLADVELCLTAFAAHRIKKFQTSCHFVETIESHPPPPPRCPPGKIRLHIRTSAPSSAQVRTPLSQSGACRALAGGISCRESNHGFILRLKGVLNVGQACLGYPMLGELNQARNKLSRVGVRRFLDLACSFAQGGAVRAASPMVAGAHHHAHHHQRLVASGAHPGAVRPSSGAGATTYAVARAGTLAAGGAQVAGAAGVPLLQQQQQQRLVVVSTPGSAPSSRAQSPVAATGVQGASSSAGGGEYMLQLVQKSNARRFTPSSLQESLENRRRQQRRDKLRLLGQTNALRCAACPTYGRDLVEAVTVVQDPRPPLRCRWGGTGYVACLNAPAKGDAQLWRYTRALRSLVHTPPQLLDQMRDLLTRFVFAVPGVTAPRIEMRVSHPSPSSLNAERVLEERLRDELGPQCAFLHPIVANLQTQFPELRLIQYDCGKLQVLDRLLWQLRGGQHRVLIFTQMTRMLDILEQFLNYHGHTYLRLDGSTRVDQRQALMERFNADRRIFCFILSTRSGGIGVNLTGADTVVFYDSDWNPTMDAQAQDRCHRIGQTRDVHIYRQTVEENILKKATQKRMLGDVAIEGGNFTTAFFKKVGSWVLIIVLWDFVLACLHLQTTLKDLFGNNFDTNEAREEPPRPPEERAPDGSEKFSAMEFEKALGMAEEELDVQAAHTARAEAAAELAEFDESIPLDTDSRDNEEKSQAEEELDKLMDQAGFLMGLSPVEKYAMQFLESLQEPLTLEQLKQAEEEIEAQKKDWELGRLKAIKEEEERRAGGREQEEGPALVYSREDAHAQKWIEVHPLLPQCAFKGAGSSQNDSLGMPLLGGKEHKGFEVVQMPTPTHYLACMGDGVTATPLPPLPATASRKQKARKEDAVHIPKSLFDRPTAAILKMRREAKMQKVKNLMALVGGPLAGVRPLNPGAFMAARPLVDLSQDTPEWLIHEDWAALQVLQQMQDIPLNLTVLSPGHTPNWDLMSDVVNAVSRIYRSPKQCKDRYETVIVPREEGKILYDTNPKKQKKTKGIYKVGTKNNKPMRTSQLFSQDCNQAFTALYSTRFETIRAVAAKRTPTLKPHFTNPMAKNPKHAAVLAENGINYDQPLSPVKLAAQRAERIAREKQKNQVAAANVQISLRWKLVHHCQLSSLQIEETSLVHSTPVLKLRVSPFQVAAEAQRQQAQAGGAAATPVAGVAQVAAPGSAAAALLAQQQVATQAVLASLGQPQQLQPGTQLQKVTAVATLTQGTLRAQRPQTAVVGAAGVTTTMTMQDIMAVATGQVRGLAASGAQAALVTTATTAAGSAPAVVSVTGLAPAQLQAAPQRIAAVAAVGQVAAAPGVATVQGSRLTASQLQAMRQNSLYRQQQQQQQQQRLQVKHSPLGLPFRVFERELSRASGASPGAGQGGTPVAPAPTAKVAVSVAAPQQRPLQQQQQGTKQQQQQQGPGGASSQQAASKPLAITRPITDAEMQQLFKRQELRSKQVGDTRQSSSHGSTLTTPVSPSLAQMTQAQVHLLAQAQQLQQQQQAAAASQQSLTAGVQTPVATLVKTVSAPSALGASAASVTIPVSAVTMAGVNINVSGAVTSGGTVGGATTVSPATQMQLHAMLQKSSQQQQQQGGTVATVTLAPSGSTGGVTTATLVPTRIMTLQQQPGAPT
ncbi:E1A-binding protein p400, putative, partial [Ixodes scapularis]